MQSKTLVAWVVAGACALAGTLAAYLPDGQVQEGADTVAQVCEANGVTAYPRGEDGERIPRPAAAGQPSRRLGIIERGAERVPVLLPPAAASSTVSDVGPAQ
jgi:hypothetical protein